MDAVVDTHEPLIVMRPGGENVVMISMKEYASLKEMEHLYSSEKNAKRLFDALEEVRSGKAKKRELIEV